MQVQEKWSRGQVSTAERNARKGVIAVSTPYQVLFDTRNAEIFTARIAWNNRRNILQSSGAAPM